MKVHKNYVKVLSVMDSRKEAWKTSRPMFSEENLNFSKVADMDLSLNSMLVYTIEMRSSVLFRDLLFSVRPMEGWALSTRSMPISRDTVRLSEEYSGLDDEYSGIDNMFNLLDDGYSRDQARDCLPCSASSTYTFTMDFRVLIAFCKAVREVSETLYAIYCIPLLFKTDNLDAIKTSTVKSSLEYNIIHDCESEHGTKYAGNMVIGCYPMKMALASQFLRQHYSKIKIGLWNILKSQNGLMLPIGLKQSSIVDVAFYIDKNSYHRLMAMRSHWVIDHSADMWGTIVGDYIGGMSTREFWEFTPAGGGKEDPYWADCYNRVLLEDPGVPCPIMTEWRGAIDARREEVGKNAILDMYEKLFDEGFIIDNPNNTHRKKYFELLETREKMI